MTLVNTKHPALIVNIDLSHPLYNHASMKYIYTTYSQVLRLNFKLWKM